MKYIKAIGFDLGETLFFNEGIGLNWKEHYIPAIQISLDKLKIKYSDNQLLKSSEILTEYNTRINPRVIEVNCDVIFRRIVNETGLPDSIDLMQFEDEFFGYFSNGKQMLYEDTEITLLKIKEMGYKIGYLTDVAYGQKRPSDNNSRLILEKLLSIASIYLSSVDVGFRKPEVYGFVELAKRFGCKPEEVIYIGNEEKDIKSSNNSGMISCLISREKEEHNWGQVITIRKLYDIVNLLKE